MSNNSFTRSLVGAAVLTAGALTLASCAGNMAASNAMQPLTSDAVIQQLVDRPLSGKDNMIHLKPDGSFERAYLHSVVDVRVAPPSGNSTHTPSTTIKQAEIKVSGSYEITEGGVVCATNAPTSEAANYATCFTFMGDGRNFSYTDDRSGQKWTAVAAGS